MQLFILIIFVSILLSALFVRRLWMFSKLEEYGLNALYYCHRNQVSAIVADEMSQIWPASHIMLELWNWDFSRYVVHQDHLIKMNEFISKELERKDLDLKRWEEENGPSVQTASDTNKDESQPPAQ